MNETSARKCRVTLTVNEDLLSQAHGLTDNLSNVVETLLVGTVARERLARDTRARECSAAAAAWNRFNRDHGSFAEEHSPLTGPFDVTTG